MPTLIDYYTLCDADCSEGIHNPAYEVCDRCGARIHNKIFVVITDAGEEITVGSECFKDVMGYSFGKYHERALEFKPIVSDLVKRRYKYIAHLYKTLHLFSEKMTLGLGTHILST